MRQWTSISCKSFKEIGVLSQNQDILRMSFLHRCKVSFYIQSLLHYVCILFVMVYLFGLRHIFSKNTLPVAYRCFISSTPGLWFTYYYTAMAHWTAALAVVAHNTEERSSLFTSETSFYISTVYLFCQQKVFQELNQTLYESSPVYFSRTKMLSF